MPIGVAVPVIAINLCDNFGCQGVCEIAGIDAVARVMSSVKGVFSRVVSKYNRIAERGVGTLDIIGTSGLRFNTQQVLYITTVFLFNSVTPLTELYVVKPRIKETLQIGEVRKPRQRQQRVLRLP